MTAVTARLDDGATRQFEAPRRARVLALVTVGFVAVVGGLTMWRATRYDTVRAVGETAAIAGMMIPFFCLCVALLGLFVRWARLLVDADGVRWGYAAAGFRLSAQTLGVARVYRDAIALVPRRGLTTWYLGRRDWEDFPALVAAFRRAGLPVEELDRRAPLLASLQSYGRALDVMLVLSMVTVAAVALLL